MADLQDSHLIIGLGGTGGKVLRSFRKTMFQNKSDSLENVNIDYLYVDSSDEHMGPEDPSWKTLGTNVQLPQAKQLKIAGLNLDDVAEDIGAYPGIAPWLGNKQAVGSILHGADMTNILGGQKRKLGRFLFACRVNDFRQRVRVQAKELTAGTHSSLTFHFIVGLAGGTGSGSIIDAICQTRSMFPSTDYKIMIYALLPDKYPKEGRNRENYHANGYAALLELNALDLGYYQPYDVSNTVRGRLVLDTPFNLCYLFTDENEYKNRVDVDSELPDIVSSFLFQKLVNTTELVRESAGGDIIKRQESLENVSEATMRETALVPPFKPLRSRRFFTFGTKQIAYPEEEISEYLTYTFAQQAALQLQYNNFSEIAGYQDQPLNRSFNEDARSPENQKRWLISDANLELSEGILPDERSNSKWKPIERFWLDVLQPLRSRVVDANANDQSSWPSKLYEAFNIIYEDNFRDLGVRRFYEIKRSELGDYRREIRKSLELDLFGQLINGTISIYECSRLITAVLGALDEKRATFEQAITKATTEEKQVVAQVSSNQAEWARVSLVGQWLGRRKRLFLAHSDAVRLLFELRHKLEALKFARLLLNDVIGEITDLSNECNRMSSTVGRAAASFASSVSERIGDAGQSNIQSQVVRFYKPEIVKDFRKTLIKDAEQQKMQTRAARLTIAASLGETPNFATFNARLDEESFRDKVVKASTVDVVAAHDALISADISRDRVLKVNVLERLEKEYGGNREALTGYIRQIVSKSGDQLVFNPTEITRSVTMTKGVETEMFRTCTVIIPEGKDQAAFRDAVVTAFEGSISGRRIEIATNPQRPNEITIMNVTSTFPARFVQDVAYLKEQYQKRVGDGAAGALAAAELHTEGDGKNWPDLFIRRVTSAEVLPYVLIANAMGLVQPIKDSITGVEGIYLVTKDASGRDKDTQRLGADLTEAGDVTDPITFDTLENNIQELLNGDYLHLDKRTILYGTIRATVEQYTSKYPNPTDPTRKLYIAADISAEKMLGLS